MTDTFRKMMYVFFAMLLFIAPVFSIHYAFADEDELPEGEVYDSTTEKDPIRSIEGDFFQPVLFKSINDGVPLLPTDTTIQNRVDANNAILENDRSKKYSLYERFGGNLVFPRYWGEEVLKTGFIDKIYDHLQTPGNDNDSLIGKIEDVWDLLTREDSEYTNLFYKTRPELKMDGSDPRVELKHAGEYGDKGKSMELSWANYFLATTEFFVYLTSAFAGDSLVDFVTTIPDLIFQSTAWQSIKNLFYVPLIIVGIFLVIWIVKKFPLAYKGDFPIRKFLLQFFTSMLTLGLFSLLVINPSLFWGITQKALSVGDDIVDGVVNSTALTDPTLKDVVHTTNNPDEALEATLWCEAVFKPWVVGVFGREYDQLYTLYDDNGNLLDLSIGDVVMDPDTGDMLYAEKGGKKRVVQGRQSAIATTDAVVPVGSELIRNWAALAYSCSSIYHIDTESKMLKAWEDNDFTPDDVESHVWPQAGNETTQNSVYNDDFKWIDAMLNIGNVNTKNDENYKSPMGYVTQKSLQINSNGTIDKNNPERLKAASYYEFRGLEMSIRSLSLGLLLIPILYLGIMKVMYILRAAFNGLILLKNSFLNLLNPDNKQYSLEKNLKNIVNPVLYYFWYLIMILVCVELYKLMGTSTNIAIQILYVALSIYLCKSKPESIKADYRKFVASANTNVIDRMSDVKHALQESHPLQDARRAAKRNASNAVKDAKAAADKAVENVQIMSEEGDTIDEKHSNFMDKKKTKQKLEDLDNEEQKKIDEAQKFMKPEEKATDNKIREDIRNGREDQYTTEFLETRGFTRDVIDEIKSYENDRQELRGAIKNGTGYSKTEAGKKEESKIQEENDRQDKQNELKKMYEEKKAKKIEEMNKQREERIETARKERDEKIKINMSSSNKTANIDEGNTDSSPSTPSESSGNAPSSNSNSNNSGGSE